MKISCDRAQLLAAFSVAASVAPQRSPKPILQNVRLDVGTGDGVLMATDMEMGVRVDVAGIEIEQPGTTLLPVGRFGPILRESSDAKLRIVTDNQGTTVKGDRSTFKLPAANPEEFPSLASSHEERYHVLPARLFRELVRRTLFATETESSRYALGGVLFEFEKDKITAVGTDGRRLAKMEGPATSHGDHLTTDAMTIVPARALQLMDRGLSDADSEVRITARPNDIVVKAGRVTFFSRLVEGRFPRWRDVFPYRQQAVKIEFAVGPVLSALRQAAVVTSEESRGIDFAFGDGQLVLSGSTAEVGQSRVELPIAYTGPTITVSMDHRYVADFLKVLDPEKTFCLEIESSEAAALFTTEDGYGYVVMPLARDR